MSVFPKETLETAATKMLDPGKDFTLPSIKIKGQEVITNGLALFNNDKLTGHLFTFKTICFIRIINWKNGNKCPYNPKAY